MLLLPLQSHSTTHLGFGFCLGTYAIHLRKRDCGSASCLLLRGKQISLFECRGTRWLGCWRLCRRFSLSDWWTFASNSWKFFVAQVTWRKFLLSFTNFALVTLLILSLGSCLARSSCWYWSCVIVSDFSPLLQYVTTIWLDFNSKCLTWFIEISDDSCHFRSDCQAGIWLVS